MKNKLTPDNIDKYIFLQKTEKESLSKMVWSLSSAVLLFLMVYLIEPFGMNYYVGISIMSIIAIINVVFFFRARKTYRAAKKDFRDLFGENDAMF